MTRELMLRWAASAFKMRWHEISPALPAPPAGFTETTFSDIHCAIGSAKWHAGASLDSAATLQELNMSQFATVTGPVTFTPGDGAPIKIPKGRIEVDLAPDSATLSWEAAPGIPGVAAIPLTQFKDYVRDGLITLEQN